MFKMIAAYLNDESGATAIEYGLIAALVSVAGIAAFKELGTSLGTLFETVAATVDEAQPDAGGATPPATE